MAKVGDRTAVITSPGRELANDRVRAICRKLVREQGWRYFWAGGNGYPQLVNPQGTYLRVPRTPDNHWNFERKAKRLGAVLDNEYRPRHSSFEGESLFSDTTETPWTESEWRERQRGRGWREALAGLEPLPEPEPKPEPTPAQRSLMAKLASDRVIRDDAKGTGRWSLADARQMLRDGYDLERVIVRTGWGRMWLADLADRLARG